MFEEFCIDLFYFIRPDLSTKFGHITIRLQLHILQEKQVLCLRRLLLMGGGDVSTNE